MEDWAMNGRLGHPGLAARQDEKQLCYAPVWSLQQGLRMLENPYKIASAGVFLTNLSFSPCEQSIHPRCTRSLFVPCTVTALLRALLQSGSGLKELTSLDFYIRVLASHKRP